MAWQSDQCPFRKEDCIKERCHLHKDEQCVILTIAEALAYANVLLNHIEMNGRGW
jgi:hypothetical protein